MNEKRYYSVDYDEQYYIFDSNVIRKGRVEEEAEYSYDVFANSMSSTEIIDKLNELTNENEQLKSSNMEMEDYLGRLEEENKQLKEELGSFEQVSFTDLCDKSRTVLYMKKENGDSE